MASVTEARCSEVRRLKPRVLWTEGLVHVQ